MVEDGANIIDVGGQARLLAHASIESNCTASLAIRLSPPPDCGSASTTPTRQSTRPGAELLSPEQELERVAPVLEALGAHFGSSRAGGGPLISIDTFHSEVGQSTKQAGFPRSFWSRAVRFRSTPIALEIKL